MSPIRSRLFRVLALALFATSARPSHAATARPYDAEIARRAAAIQSDVVTWRRDFHEHPELSNREVRTSGIVAEKLKAMGLEVKTGVAHTGVVAILKGGKPGPVVALRADMDALPVTEETDVPFRSHARGTYNGADVGVMHACGHDAHTAMMLGVAQVLSQMRAQVPGTVKFIFQPAEEGAPAGEQGGAKLMIDEGVLADPKPEAIFGMHVVNQEYNTIRYKPEGELAASDVVRIQVQGRQTHGGRPWEGVDPVVTAAQIVMGLQTIVSRQVDVTLAPAVLSIGMVKGGVRNNIIPDSVAMEGTLRTYDKAMRADILTRIERTAKQIAAANGATASVAFLDANPVTWNDPALTTRMGPSLLRAGATSVGPAKPKTWAEDFASYAERIPGFYFFLGVDPPGSPEGKTAPNHSPRFYVEEGAMQTGVRAMCTLALDYLNGAH